MRISRVLQVSIVTLLPEIFSGLNYGVVGRAIEQNLLQLNLLNPRKWAKGKYKKVDDSPYGGGPGMVLMYEPIHKAINHAKETMPDGCKTIYLSPQGKKIYQSDLMDIANKNTPLIFLAGRYEGVDERIIDNDIDEEWSLGDFVLSGGEIAAMAFIDAITRLLPGSLGHPASPVNDSFTNGLLDYPHYTRPEAAAGLYVPKVLLSGDHKEIERWRKKQSLGVTWLKRPELLKKIKLSNEDQKLLNEFKTEQERAC